MNADAIPAIAPDTLPPPAAPPGAGGAQFFALLNAAHAADTGNANGAAPNSAAKPAQGGATNATTVTTGNPSKTPPSSPAKRADDGNTAKTSDSGTTSVAAVLPLPTPLPLTVPSPQPLPAAPAAAALPAGASAAAIPAPAQTAATALLSGTALNSAAAQLPAGLAGPGPVSNASALGAGAVAAPGKAASAAATSLPAALPIAAPSNGAAPTVTANTAAPTPITDQNAPRAAGTAAPSLPSTPAGFGARVAAGAQKLVSQPSVALASLAPEQGKAADTLTPSHGTAATEAPHDLGKPAIAAAPDGDGKLAAVTAKPLAPTPGAPSTGNLPAPPASASGVNSAASDANLVANSAATSQAAAATTPVPNAPSPPEPAAAASPALPPPPVFEQVAFSIRQAAKSGVDHIQIQLQPADLGAIQVKLNVSHEGRVEMVVSADRSDTLNLLQQDSGNLTQALRDAGLQADSSSLSFNLRGGNQSNQHAGGGASGSSGLASNEGFEESGTLPGRPTLRAHAGSVDIHV